MNKLIFIFCLLAVGSQAFSQDMTVEGKVVDALNSKGIKAQMRYKSYPTGGISGRINDSTFSFPIFGSSKYQVTAEAEGYIPRTMIVDPKEAINGKIIRNIQLTSKGRAIRLEHLIFEMGRAVINPKSYLGLDEVVAMMKENTKVVIQLEGHTDNAGNAEKNLALSQDRVEAVKKYLVSKGIAKDRVKTKAFGGTQPLSTDKTEEARALNRRVEMRVLKD
jgi:OmpA-OmpF porin, OOP family